MFVGVSLKLWVVRLTYFFIVCIVFYSSFVALCTEVSQNSDRDSLLSLVDRMGDDTNKVHILNDLSYQYLGYQLDTSLLLGQRALDLSEKLDYQYGIASSLFQLGLVLRYQSKYEKAIEYLTLSYELFDQMNNSEEKARALNSLGNVYNMLGNYEKSLENFFGSFKIYEQLQDSVKISYVLNNLGGLYLNMGENEKGLDFYIQSLDLKRKLDMTDKIPIALMNIGIIYKKKRDYTEALNYFKEALDLMDGNTSKYDRLLLLNHMGTIYESTRRYKIAKDYYQKAIEIEEEIGEKEMMVFSMQGMGNIFVLTGNYNKGINYLLRSYNLAVELGNLSMIRNLTASLSKVYEEIRDFKNSLIYYQIYQIANDSLLGIEKIKQVTELEQKYESEKRDRQIAFLEKEKAIQELELSNKEIENKQKSFQRNVLVIISILAIALLVYYFRDNKRRKKLNDLLRKQNKKIGAQREVITKRNGELTESNNTKDRLLQIIAHDLRSPLVSIDSITQLIPFWVEEQDYASLEKLSTSLDLSIRNVLSLIDNLLTWALSQQGAFPNKPEKLRLKKSIQEIVKVYEPIAQIKNIDLLFKVSGDIVVFADKNILFTVLRNLLNNAIKFTKEKGKITVGMESNRTLARIWVKDTGIGIPEHKKESLFEIAKGHSKGTKGEPGKGLGLFFCKEFVTMNKGNIFIDSKEKKGTTITFTLPLFNLEES